MTLPDPTLKLIGWAATRTAEAIVDRYAGRIVTKARCELADFTKQRTSVIATSAVRRFYSAIDDWPLRPTLIRVPTEQKGNKINVASCNNTPVRIFDFDPCNHDSCVPSYGVQRSRLTSVFAFCKRDVR